MYSMEKRWVYCKRCGHRWEKRVEEPIECPYCKSFRWKVPPKEITIKKKELKRIENEIKKDTKEIRRPKID